MSDIDRPLTERKLAPLLARMTQTADDLVKAVSALTSQNAALMVTNALLLRELGRTGIVNVETIKAEAIERAQRFDPPTFRSAVVEAVTSLFGNESPGDAEPARFTVIDGGLSEPPRG